MDDFNSYTVPVNTTLVHAVEKIQLNHSRAVIVLDQGKVIGILSEGDVMRALLAGTDIHAPLREMIHSSFKFLNKLDKHAAFELCRKYAISLLPVVDDNFKLKAVITLAELLKDAQLK